MPEVKIADRAVGDGHPPYVVAEAGVNHNGELARALAMVSVARKAGADAIKYQTFKADEFVADPEQTYTYRSQGKNVTESMLAMFRRYELPVDAWKAIRDRCVSEDIVFLSTAQNRSDLDLLLALGLPAIKVGSDDFTNVPLLRDYASCGLPLILSCGMADLAEIRRSLEVVGSSRGHPTVLLLCTSQYPTPPEDVNLRKLETLRREFPEVVLGLSDHTQGPLASSVAVGLGAAVFEKHFTLDHDLPGPDHWFSEDPIGLEEWVRSIRTAHRMLGSREVRATPAEEAMKVVARRSIVALREIGEGDILDSAAVGLRRPGHGLPPSEYERVLGRRAARRIAKGSMITKEDFR